MADPIEDLPGEIWKPVVGYEGYYEVSSCGRVRRVERMIRHGRWGEHLRRWPGRVMSPHAKEYGHLSLGLYRDGKRVTHNVHTLVATAFLGPRPEGTECCHNNGNPADNRVENLRWDTPVNNNRDKHRHGTQPRGVKHYLAKLTPDAVRDIRARVNEPLAVLAREYGVCEATVRDARDGRTWRHIEDG